MIANVTSGAPSVQVITKDQLLHEEGGVTRGYAHVRGADAGSLDFGPLTLFAEGWLRRKEGFEMHEHSGIENLLFVRRGSFEHRDSLGNERVVGARSIALLSAATPVSHAERVHGDAEVHAAVIWLATTTPAPPRFEARRLSATPVQVLASGRGEGGLALGVPSTLRHVALGAGECLALPVHRRAYLFAFAGGYRVNGHAARSGERVLVRGSGSVHVEAEGELELLALDLG